MKPPLSGYSATNGVERVEREDKKSQYRGVSYARKKAKWRVQIKVAALGKSGVSVGYFDTEEAAARAYDRAAIGLLGRNAPHLQTNFDVAEYEDESIPDLSGKSREEVKTALKSERIKQAPRRRFVSRQRTSQFMGVGSSNRKNQWQARILVHGKVTHLGYYETEEDAARVYDRVSLALHGNNAQTNYPVEEYPEEEIMPFTGLDRESLQRALGVKPMDKSSRFRGVSKKKGKWEAKVMVNRRWAYRELFDSEEAAARAYDKALWRLKPLEAASYVNFKDDMSRGDFGGPSASLAARSMESVEFEDDVYPPEDDQGYDQFSSDGDFEYEYKPTKGTSRSEKMRAKKATASGKDVMSLRKSAPSPVRTKRAEQSRAQPKFSMVPGEGMKFIAANINSAAGTSLESASTPLGDHGMIPNLSTSSFHDQEELMIRVGSETHLVPPSSSALPIHNDPCVHLRSSHLQSQYQQPPRLPAAGMKRATSEPYIASLDFGDPLDGIEDLINDADMLYGKGVDLSLLTGSVGHPEGMDHDLMHIQNFVETTGTTSNPQPSHIVFQEDEEIALNGLEYQPKPRKLSKSVSMQNLACEDVSDAAAASNNSQNTSFHPGSGRFNPNPLSCLPGKPPCMPPKTSGSKGDDNLSSRRGLRRINTFTCSLPSLEELDAEPTPRLRNSSHNSSDEDLVKQLWAGEAHLPSLHI